MRIAYVCADPGVPIFGRKGNSVHVQEVVRALLANGANVELFATATGGEAPSGLDELRVHPLAALPKFEVVERERAALVANGALYALLEENGPFDMVYERYSLWSFMGIEYARNNGIAGLLEVNAPLVEEQAAHRALADRHLAEWVANKVFSAATALLAVSQEVAAYLEERPGARGRVHIVPNGVNPQRFCEGTLPTYPGKPGVVTAGFVGTLKPWHGLSALAESFALLNHQNSSTRLLIVGDGPERESLRSNLEERGVLDSVCFTGSVDPGEIPGLLASMDIAVAPYADSEHFYFSPLKVYEYMAAGLPVVASRVGQLNGLIRHEVNGLLCPPGDTVALAAALERLRRDSALRIRLGNAARETVLHGHTWDAVAERILAIAMRATPQAASIGRM
ncbi:MAG TPA: glycosyltransferase family 4 protein [Chloroflexia bacterium]|nr:glycosyltransferase family 4 protein [Chloroflexia bacterium]